MKTIIRTNYPISKLPADLREGFEDTATVTVTILPEEPRPKHVLSLDEIWAMRKPPFRTKEEIDADIRRRRDEWDN
jgi:hypothetical protein